MFSRELKSVLERIKEIFGRMSWRIPKMVRALGESERERERERERGYKLGKVLIIKAHLAEQSSVHLYIP